MEHQNEFCNKNIVITGASSGIGLSAAFYFLNCNANVILICQDTKSMDKIWKENNFENGLIIQADLEKKKEIEKVLSLITKLFPTIDILINCAGIKLDNDIEKTYENDFAYTMHINLRSVFILLKEFRPYFSNGASVINLSCLYGTRPMYGVITYAMSKAGLETLTRYAAAEFSNLNIRINAISACPVNTNSLRYVKVSENEINYFNNKMKNDIPLGRIAEPHDIVKAIIFLASCRSSKITGQIIKVDGGRSLTSSGYVHYKGMENMNVKFEPDSLNLKNFVENIFKTEEEKKMDKPITNKDELKKFVEQTISQSNFSTRDRDAHFNIYSSYYKVRETDTNLTNRYLKGSIPNYLLLEKNGNNFGTLSYNPIQKPIFEISNSEISPSKSQMYKEKFEENKNDFYFNNFNNSNLDNNTKGENNENIFKEETIKEETIKEEKINEEENKNEEDNRSEEEKQKSQNEENEENEGMKESTPD